MPLLKLTTNAPAANRSSLLAALSAHTAELLQKPERFVMITFEQNADMLFAGSSAPLAYIELKSIGLPEQRTRRLAEGLCRLVQTELGIPADRVYIEFSNAARHLWGWNAGTFEK